MTNQNDQLGPIDETQSVISTSVQAISADFRRDLAFPTLPVEMVQRLQSYGSEEVVPENTTLYTRGDRDTDMFVVLDGGIHVLLPSVNGGFSTFARHRKNEFSGELSL